MQIIDKKNAEQKKIKLIMERPILKKGTNYAVCLMCPGSTAAMMGGSVCGAPSLPL